MIRKFDPMVMWIYRRYKIDIQLFSPSIFCIVFVLFTYFCFQEQVDEFIVPPCSDCGGILKPEIVFFGDNVTRQVVNQVRTEVESADSLLVLGTSLTTFSGYRIVLQAVEARKPIAIVSIGETRADNHANVKIHGRCGEVLSKIYGNQRENIVS